MSLPMTKRKSTKRTAVAVLPAQGPTVLLADVRELILSARKQMAQTVNSGLTMLCWHVGSRIRKNILKEKRAEYGQEILQSLSAKLGWTHFPHLIYLDDPLKRDFYAARMRLTADAN